jgi:predicted Zn finger-like uncharacterized protein
MILSCNSCEKKFIVPDKAIGATGRLVQCSSCGNKWNQFPIISEVKNNDKKTSIKSVLPDLNKNKKNKIKKRTGPSLYSPEYLAKKHGIKIEEGKSSKQKNREDRRNINFGFYNSLIIFVITIIFIIRIVYFFQNILIEKFPFSEIYIDYLFESIRNMREIIFNIFSKY